MSEVLQVAKALSRSTDAELVRVIGIRLMPSGSFNDFFDFAAALLKPQNVSGAIAGLTRKQIIAFSNLLENKSTKDDAESLEVLATLFLVEKKITSDKASYIPLESAISTFKTLVSKKIIGEAIESKSVSSSFDSALVDPQAGVGAFETVQALTELLIELEQRYVREVGRGAVGLPELKRLSSHLGRTVEYARSLYALAQMSSLVVLSDKRWRVGSHYLTWLKSSPTDRWLHLAQTWRLLLGEDSASELAGAVNLSTAMAETFPLANDGISSHMTRLVSLAELIGLTSGDEMSSWFSPLMQGDLKRSGELLSGQLPKAQNKIIVQADLTIISVGPLPTEIELELRRFVETERIGVASTYRINSLSVTYGLETGLTETSIRDLLMNLSDAPLPQPVDYLIREAAQRFGRLVLTESANTTLISSNDQILLAQILNDSNLKTISISKQDETTLVSRFELDIVYYQLRDSKYAAIRKDAKGKVISNWSAAGGSYSIQTETKSVLSDIARWRAHDKRLGEDPQGGDIVRQLEMAIKNKGSIEVAVNINGQTRQFTLEPSGLANGRLRARDRKADCERVLPLTSITSVRIG
ncbi:MAG: hypothetical protein EBS85_02405 [Micrococcales bacterium]|jgi:hypothetical protein|nr:hypothetical protein [Actinomycetota bacterium]NCA07567.1 hypothetical protein [Micrococcales bacterium]